MRQKRHSGSRYSKETRSQICKIYEEEGLSAAAISRLPNMPSEKTVRAILKSSGIESLRGVQPQFDREQILQDLESMSPKAVAIKHQCSERHVWDVRKRAARAHEEESQRSSC